MEYFFRSGSGTHVFQVWLCLWKFLESMLPVSRTLVIMQNPILQVVFPTSLATEEIWVICSAGIHCGTPHAVRIPYMEVSVFRRVISI
jgi:hypothetical protein